MWYLHPYKVGWIKFSTGMLVNKVYKVPLSIGKSYEDEITCDILDMTICHLILSRSWQIDKDVIYKGKEYVLFLVAWQEDNFSQHHSKNCTTFCSNLGYLIEKVVYVLHATSEASFNFIC